MNEFLMAQGGFFRSSQLHRAGTSDLSGTVDNAVDNTVLQRTQSAMHMRLSTSTWPALVLAYTMHQTLRVCAYTIVRLVISGALPWPVCKACTALSGLRVH
jgi:hypothetical protein